MSGGADQTLRPFLWRAERLFPDTEIVARTGDGVVRTTYADYGDRIRRLANALAAAGVEPGDRVGTVCWNHDRHFETYFAVPNMGAQLHTVNPLLPGEHLRAVAREAGDRIVFVDASLAGTVADAYDPDAFGSVERFVVVGTGATEVDLPDAVPYESFVAGHGTDYEWPRHDGDRPAGLCHTSGTTGRPRGVEYTQRMLWSHTMATLSPMGFDLDETDAVMPVVPMFHVNAWGLPYTATAAGAKHVYPGPSPDPADVARLVETEDVTVAAGVPTVWLGLLEYLEDHDADLATLDQIYVGGAAAPRHLVRRFDERGVEVVHAWGMTETSPVGLVSKPPSTGTDADDGTRLAKRLKQGRILPGLEFEVVDDRGEEVPRDGETFGELLVRGPWVAREYLDGADEGAFEGDWLRTGDVVTVDEEGYVEVVDRAVDAIKSGGEWISSQALEGALMAHDGVAEAAVIGVPHDRYGERPVAFVAAAAGAPDEDALEAALRDAVRADHPDWWVPDAFVFVDEVPKTATGKFSKEALRESHGDASLVAGRVDQSAAPDGAEE